MRQADGRVLVDPTGRMPGRGAYVCGEPACRAAAVSKGALARALRTQIPTDLEADLGLAPIPSTPTEGGSRGQE